MRLARFAVELELEVDADTLTAASLQAQRLAEVAQERVFARAAAGRSPRPTRSPAWS